jgi:hypothetical protein
MMKDELRIPMQVCSELRIKNTGELVVGNPEIELSGENTAADAVLSYRFDANAMEHILRLLEPVADHDHLRKHRRDD